MHPAWTIAIAVVSSSAVFGFVQFLIGRHDNKNDKFEAISKQIKDISDNLKLLANKVDENDAKMSDMVERDIAIQARIRILQASDEMRRSIYHSKEYFDQLHEDITSYEDYCRRHVDFKNNKSVHAIENINRVYQKCLQEDTFL